MDDQSSRTYERVRRIDDALVVDAHRDGEPPNLALALARLGPVIDELIDALEAAGIDPELAGRAVTGMAEAYVAGHRDGARDAAPAITPGSGRHGLHLVLAPGPEADSLVG